MALPIPLFHHQADVHFIAGPINAAVGKNESIEIFREDAVDAVDVEARKIEHPIVARVRDEADVITQPSDIYDRFLFVFVLVDRGETDATIGRSRSALRSDSVAAEKFNRHAGDRLAGLDRSDENVAAAIGVLFHEQTEIAHENEAGGESRFDVLLRGRVPTARFQKE